MIVEISIKGIIAIFPKNTLEKFLLIKKEIDERKFDIRTRKVKYYGKKIIEVPLYTIIDDNFRAVGLGAIDFLKKNNKELEFIIKSIFPEDRKLLTTPIDPPKTLLDDPNFIVKTSNGHLSRFYFFEALEACRMSNFGCLIQIPTGGGKTFIEISLAYHQEKILGRQLIIVPTISIKDQFIGICKKLNINIMDYRESSLIENLNNIPGIIIAIPTSIINDISNKKNKELLDSVRCLIVDEAHRSSQETWTKLFFNLKNVYRINGFSATTISKESLSKLSFSEMNEKDALNISICGDLEYSKSPRDLKDFLNLPTLINILYTWKNYTKEVLKNADWLQVSKDIQNNKDRIKFISNIIKILQDKNYNIITFVNKKTYGLDILKNLNEKSCCWFSKELHFLRNNEIISNTGKNFDIDSFRNSFGVNYNTIIGSSSLIEGLDLKNPLNAIVLTEGRSERETIQKLGRIVRKSNKKSLIINVSDKNHSILKNQSIVRSSISSEEFECDIINLDESELENLKNIIQDF